MKGARIIEIVLEQADSPDTSEEPSIQSKKNQANISSCLSIDCSHYRFTTKCANKRKLAFKIMQESCRGLGIASHLVTAVMRSWHHELVRI